VATLANADSNGFLAQSIDVDVLRASEGGEGIDNNENLSSESGEASEGGEGGDNNDNLSSESGDADWASVQSEDSLPSASDASPQLADEQKREAASFVQMDMASDKEEAESFLKLEKHLEQARQVDAQKEAEEEHKLSQNAESGVAADEPTNAGAVDGDTSPPVEDSSTPGSFIQVKSDSVDPESDAAMYGNQDEGKLGGQAETFIQVEQVDKSAEDLLEQARQLNDKKEIEEDKRLHSAAPASSNASAQVQSDSVGPDSDLASLKVEGEAFIQVQSATAAVDQESDLASYGKQVKAWMQLHPDSDLALHAKRSGVSFMQVAESNAAETQLDATAPSSFAQVQSDYVDPESDLALYSKERSLMQIQGSSSLGSEEKTNLWKTMQARHWVPSVAPSSFVQEQSDYVDPESDFALGLQAQGHSPEKGHDRVEVASNVADNQLSSSGTQVENNVVQLIGTEDSLSDAAGSENTLDESAGYTDSEVARETGPMSDDASPPTHDKSAPSGVQSVAKSVGAGSTVHVQSATSDAKVVVNSQALQNNGGQVIVSDSFVQVQSEQDPESDLALYSEVYQGGSMDL